MTGRERCMVAAAAALAVAFLAITTNSVVRRAENYSFYPDYSSLNNETGGVRAYYEALARVGFATGRNYAPLHKLENCCATVFYIGVAPANFRFLTAKNLELFERIANSGARLVIAFDPKYVSVEDRLAPRVPPPPPKAKPRESVPAANLPPDNLKARWGVSLARKPDPTPAGEEAPPDQTFHRELWTFAAWSPEWHAAGDFVSTPLLLERKFGRGSIVLLANADLLANRQLLTSPEAAVLAGLPGGAPRVVFDESHLGVADNGSVAGLAAAHHMQWFLFGFACVALLYVWRNGVSLAPPFSDDRQVVVAGRDAHASLTHLVERSVSRTRLPFVLAAEWRRSPRLDLRAHSVRQEDLARLESLPPGAAVHEYNRIAARLKSPAGAPHAAKSI